MEPISRIESSPLIIEGGRRWDSEAAAPRQPLPPFWRDLTAGLLAAPSDEARFALLRDIAAGAGALPASPEAELPPIPLKIREDELCAWAAAHTPTARGRLYRLLHGANVDTPWPYHLLQSGGRFSVQWKRRMCDAAQRYVDALAVDTATMALLLQPLEALPPPRRGALVDAMTRHACDAWEVRAPIVSINLREDEGSVQRAAETTFKEDGRVEFFPWAFAQGPIELLAVVFHESTHLVQMARLHANRVERALLGSAAAASIDDHHADILRLSFDYAGSIGTRQYGNYYYLYRFETEVEREAHLAGLEAALVASGRPEFNPRQSGTLAAVLAQADDARRRLDAYDPNLVAQAYVEEKTGLRIARIGAMAERAGDDFTQRASTLSTLMKRQAATPPGLRLAALTLGAGVSLAVLASLRRQRRPQAAIEAAGPVTGGWVWQALQRLQQLRDTLDRSGMLAQAILSSAPKALYGVSEESRFLRAAFSTALDPDGLALPEFARRHLEQKFALAASGNHQSLEAALQRVRARYRSPLAREILLDAACGLAAADDALRARLKKAAGIT